MKGRVIMSKKWYPVINCENCTECGACINKCSHGVYDKESDTPKAVYPEGCIDGCRGCQQLCPTGAIDYVGDTGINDDKGCDCNCSCS